MLLGRLTLYVVTLAVYTPYLVFSIKREYYKRFPLVFFAFIGMYLYNAIGSIYVFIPNLRGGPFGEDYFSNSFAYMIILQVVIFYLVTLPYTLLARKMYRAPKQKQTAKPLIFFVLIAAICAIIWLYIRNVGVPPGLKIITGDLTTYELLQYRIAGTYALSDYFIYNVGFMTLPIITAALACTFYLRRSNKMYIALILCCMVVSTFPGGKGSITRVSILLLITGMLYHQYYPTSQRASKIRWKTAAFLVIGTAVVVILMYRIYYGENMGGGEIVNAICYKVFGSVPETMGGLIQYCEVNGYLNGATLPNLHGFLGHETFDMNTALHVYMFGPGGMSAYPAVTEGYINFGWPGFFGFCFVTYAVVIAVERIFAWLPQTELTFSVMMVFCLIATEASQLSLSATFVSLTLTIVITLLLMLDRFGVWIGRRSTMDGRFRDARVRS
jgi:oligosaccharide repeat unit polymerase